jgi:hypothetical protein
VDVTSTNSQEGCAKLVSSVFDLKDLEVPGFEASHYTLDTLACIEYTTAGELFAVESHSDGSVCVAWSSVNDPAEVARLAGHWAAGRLVEGSIVLDGELIVAAYDNFVLLIQDIESPDWFLLRSHDGEFNWSADSGGQSSEASLTTSVAVLASLPLGRIVKPMSTSLVSDSVARLGEVTNKLICRNSSILAPA